MPLTTTDLIRAVLENLSRLAAGQPVSAAARISPPAH
jgi:hypothetical protein